MSSLGATRLKMVARALRTIFRHVILSDIISAADMRHWIENLECHIMAFSWDCSTCMRSVLRTVMITVSQLPCDLISLIT
jgi:hypothetical protein